MDEISDIKMNGNTYRVIFYDDVVLAPTADVAPVVKCKECKYYESAKVNNKGFLICPASGMEITDNDFCSYGERRIDDG